MSIGFDSIEEFKQFLKRQNKFYVFGAGYYGHCMLMHLKKQRVVVTAVIDNDDSRWGKQEDGIPIISLREMDHRKADIIIAVSPEKSRSVWKHLIEDGIDQSRICFFVDYWVWDYLVQVDFDRMLLTTPKNKFLHNLYQGQRAFAVGNGPSLREDVIKKIRKEHSFATGLSCELFDKMDWSPMGFMLNDVKLLKIMEERGLFDRVFRIPRYIFANRIYDYYAPYSALNRDNVYSYISNRHCSVELTERAIDLNQPIMDLGTSVHPMLQIMIFMGFKEIYLVGMDFKFANQQLDNGEIIVNSNVRNHSELIDPCEKNIYAVDDMKKGYELISEYCKARDICIYNATPDSALDVFEHVDFETLF